MRAARGLAPLTRPTEVAVAFSDDQPAARGWFFDPDAVGALLEAVGVELGGRAWTEIFDLPSGRHGARYTSPLLELWWVQT